MPKSLVIYHKNCPSKDGFGAAFAAWLALGDTAQYLAADYGDSVPDVSGLDVYILDLSFDEAVLKQMGEQAKSLTLLDHHETAAKRLHAFRPACCGKIHFDLEKSGAMLAWEFFHPGKPAPLLIQHIQDRDLYAWKNPKSKSFLTWLDAQDKDFERWKSILEMSVSDYESCIEKVSAVVARLNQLSEEIASKASPVRLAGITGLMVNDSGVLRSEVGSLLARQCGTFGLVWRVAEDGSVLFSLRSVKNEEGEPSVNVEVLAMRFGGGGHPSAASFKLTSSCLAKLVTGSLDPGDSE